MKHDFEKDYELFLASQGSEMPTTAQQTVFDTIHSELNPSTWAVFFKSSGIFAAVGMISLLFCPQFGVSFGAGQGLMGYLMKYGDEVCMLGCGVLFMGLSLLAVSFLLRPEEVRVFKSHRVLQLTSLSLLSISAFHCLGGEVIASSALVWALGAILGGAASLDLGWRMRKAFIMAG